MRHELYDLARANADVYFERNKKTLRGMERGDLEAIVNAPLEEQTDHSFLEYSAEKVLQERMFQV